MGIWDDINNILSGGGSGDIEDAYNEANGYLSPYQKGGAQDYQNYRNYVGNYGNSLAPFQGAGAWRYGQINQSPTDFYNNIMKGYNQSPQAKYEQDAAMKAAEAGGAASGMMGSGAFQTALQQNAGDIGARDQQRYFQNVMGANQMQEGYFGDLQNQQGQFNQMQQYLSNLGYGAGGQMGQNALWKGGQQAGIGRQSIGDITSLLAYLKGMGGGGGSGGLAGAGGGGNIDPSTMMAYAAEAGL